MGRRDPLDVWYPRGDVSRLQCSPRPPACAHTIGLGHLLHEGARAVLHPARLRVAAAGTSVEMGDLPPATVARHTQQLNPLQFWAAPRSVQRSRRLHHLPLQLLKGVGVRSQAWGRPGGCRFSGGGGVEAAAESEVSGSQGEGSRHLQNSALLLEAGPGFLRPLCALGCGEPRLNSGRHTPLHPPPPAEPPTQTPASHAPAAGPLPAWRAWPPATPVVSSRGSKEGQKSGMPSVLPRLSGPSGPHPTAPRVQ